MQSKNRSDSDVVDHDGGSRLDRAFELIAVFVFASGLIGLLAGLLGIFHAPQILTAALLCSFGYAYLVPAHGVSGLVAPSVRHLMLILLVAGLFRFTPYYYVLGGQDEGVYVNVAAELVRTGDIGPKDTVLERLDDPALVQPYVDRNYEPYIYLPGIYRGEGNPPANLEFQFYHLFPVFMALVGGLLGLKFSVYALTFLSLLSIAFIYRLALALTGSRNAALVAGLLLAVNPLHAFFSKFPVTEVPTLLFSAAAFAFLAMYWRAPPGLRLRRWLVLACFAMACLFTTRISGFMYVPFLVGMSTIALLCDTDRQRARGIHGWVVATIAVYALSIVYGMKWSGLYSGQIYDLAFAELFGERWQKPLLFILSMLAIAWMLIWPLSTTGKLHASLRRAMHVGSRFLGLAFVLVLAFGAYRLYLLGFTDHYAGHDWIARRWGLAGKGWTSALSVSLVVAAIYLSPLVWIAFFGLTLKRWQDPLMVMLLLFLLPFTAHIAVLQWTIPYQPYYARYLLSEFVPYVLLFVACAWHALDRGWLKKSVAVALLIGGGYATVLSAMQIGKVENEGAAEALAGLVADMDGDDLLLMDADNARGFNIVEIKTALLYSFGVQVMTTDQASLMDSRYVDALDSRFDDIYLMSSSAEAPDEFHFQRSVRYRVSALKQGVEPPMEAFDRYKAQIFLHRFERPAVSLEPGQAVTFSSEGRGATAWLKSGWSRPEPWGVWSTGNESAVRVVSGNESGGVAGAGNRLTVNMRAFVNPAHPIQRVGLSVDGGKQTWVTFRYPELTALQVHLPLANGQVAGQPRIEVRFETPDATSPKSLGMSADARILGIGLESMELTSAVTPAGRQ